MNELLSSDDLAVSGWFMTSEPDCVCSLISSMIFETTAGCSSCSLSLAKKVHSTTSYWSRTVEVSPSWSLSPSSIFLSSRRIIFPDRVLGRSLTRNTFLGTAKRPITSPIYCFADEPSFFLSTTAWFLRQENTFRAWPVSWSSTPTTATSENAPGSSELTCQIT